MGSIKNILFYVISLLTVIVSYFLYSPLHNIHYTSDHAVHVLMVSDLMLPEDLYYWGQNRLGSLVPILAWVLKSVLGLSSLLAISLVQYGLLAATCYLLARYLASPLLKVLLFLFCFFPLPIFPEIVFIAHPYVAQFFLIALGIYFGEKFMNHEKRKLLNLFLSFIFLGLSIWGSELSGLFYVLYAFGLWLYLFTIPGTLGQRFKRTLSFSSIFIAASGLIFLFIQYAKSKATGMIYEKAFCGWEDLKTGMKLHADAIIAVIKNPFYNIYLTSYIIVFFLMLAVILFGILKRKDVFGKDHGSILKLVFLVNALVSFLMLYLTDWVRRNNYEYRYWGYAFISFGIFLLIYWDSSTVKQKKLTFSFVSVLILLQTILSYKHATARAIIYDNETPVSELQDVKKLGSCGILGNYWSTYNLASVDPENVMAAPREGEYIRNLRQLKPLFRKEKLFLVKNRWLENFPDSIYQYGCLLKKTGELVKIRLDELCSYKRVMYWKKWKAVELSSRNTLRMADSTSLEINKDTTAFNDFVVFGPFGLLNEGKYKVKFYLKGIEGSPEGKVIMDVGGKWGGVVYDKLEINSKDIKPDKPYELKADIKELENGVEYRIFLSGKCSFILEKVEVEQVE